MSPNFICFSLFANNSLPLWRRLQQVRQDLETKTTIVGQKEQGAQTLREDNNALRLQLVELTTASEAEASQLKKRVASLSEIVSGAENLLREKAIAIQQHQANGVLDQETITELTETLESLQQVFTVLIFLGSKTITHLWCYS